MGPRKRKSKELDKEGVEKETENKAEKRSKKCLESKNDIYNEKSRKALSSKYFKKQSLDPSEPSTSSKSLESESCASGSGPKIKLSKTNKSSSGLNPEPNTSISQSKLETSTSSSSSKHKPSTSNSVSKTREVTVDQTLDMDTVKKMIRDKENRKVKAAKRIADLPPTELNKSSNENSQNMINNGSTNESRNKNKDAIKKNDKKLHKNSTETVDFSDFPNVTKFFLGRQVFGKGYVSNREVQNWYESKKLLDFKLLDRNSFVEARITTITWNKAKPNQFAFSDKHGHIVAGELQHSENLLNWKLLLQKNGIGPGGNILAMKFAKSHKPDHYSLWNVGLEGIAVRFDCAYNKEIVAVVPEECEELNYQGYLHTNNYNHWYASMDLSPDEDLVTVGCTKGYVQVMTTDGKVVENFRASKGKLSHVEFCPKNPVLLATSSLDKTVKIWDRRYIKSLSDYIANLPHEKPVNSAYFNEKCDLLLTTDQCEEIRTYDTSSWQIMSSIYHPHRQFQHLTPIKATWHPSADIIIAGRYPVDPDDPRCVDILTLEGQRICTLDSTSNKIQTVARASPDGKYMLSSFGSGIELWGIKNHQKQAPKVAPVRTQTVSDGED